MTKYIERDKAVKLIFLAADTGRAAKALSLLGKESVADVVEVVRCKDCRYFSAQAGWDGGQCNYLEKEYDLSEVLVYADDYCINGERLNGGKSDGQS